MGAEASLFYQQLKILLIDGSGLGKDALHIYAGMAIYLLVRLGLRRQAWVAWLAVLAAAVAGEWLDVEGEYLRGSLAPDGAHWHDIWNTMFWPSVLAVAERWWPRRGGAAITPSGEDPERGLEQA